MKRKTKTDPPPPRGGKIPPLEFVELFGRRVWPDNTPKLEWKPMRPDSPVETADPPTQTDNPPASR